MTAPSTVQRVIVAPVVLDLDTRTEFRRQAVRALDVMSVGAGRLVLDMTTTKSVDSAGLGTLVLIQRRAAASRIPVRLRGANEDLRFLLALTKLEDLFQLESIQN